MTTSTPIYLLKDRRPDSCFVDQIYDPDRDGLPSENMAVVIPNEGAIAVDRHDGFATYTVIKVDPTTYKSTLQPIRIIKTAEENEVIEILSYGNDKFMLYFDDRTRPTKLMVDGKLKLFGSGLAEYRLVKTTTTGEKEIISIYLDTNDTIRGNRIPVVPVTPNSSMKQCTNAHTLHVLEEGESVQLEVYDHLGLLSVLVTLFVKRATLLNDLASSTDVIVEFNATANQMDGTNFYVHQRQDVSNLVISPELIYSDGSNEKLEIDNITCFLYGLEDFVPSFPGQRQKILIKKYLGRNQVSPLSEFNGRSRYLSLEKWITVVSNQSFEGIKVSVIPMWSGGTSKYTLKFIAYTDKRDIIYDVTPYTTIAGGFNGGVFHTQQTVIFDVDLTTIFGASASVLHRQVVYLVLKPYSEYQRYTIDDAKGDTYIYGVESSTIRRPTIHYDTTLHQYFIPTSRFENREAFLEAFYYMARPPFDPDVELEPVVPTHFTVRTVDTLTTVLATPIEIDQYGQIWNSLSLGNPNQHVGGQLIVEFLNYSADRFQILYGVPVDVHISPTGYNT